MASPVKSSPRDAQVMGAILKEMGVTEYEPRVVNVMLEFVYRKTIVASVWYWNWAHRWIAMHRIVISSVWKIYDFIDKSALYSFYFFKSDIRYNV